MSQGSNKKIALMRSATMPSSTVMKRETSEAPSLSSIPVATNRGGLLNSKRFAQREVDMSSLLPEMNPKARQKAIVAAELKDAISALKRPNRELAGKSIVETAEQRSSAINSRSKFDKLKIIFETNDFQSQRSPSEIQCFKVCRSRLHPRQSDERMLTLTCKIHPQKGECSPPRVPLFLPLAYQVFHNPKRACHNTLHLTEPQCFRLYRQHRLEKPRREQGMLASLMAFHHRRHALCGDQVLNSLPYQIRR